MRQLFKKQDKKLIVKRYKNGNISLILFPDGSGNVFYVNGKIALSIVFISESMVLYWT